MRYTKPLLSIFALVVAALVTDAADAHGGRSSVRVGVGVSVGGPGYWGGGYWGGGYGGPRWGHYPRAYYGGYYGAYYGGPYYGGYYSPQPVVVVPSAPEVYVEQPPVVAAPAQPAAHWWYYCGSASGYYPYVQICPEGWRRVTPQPPPS